MKYKPLKLAAIIVLTGTCLSLSFCSKVDPKTDDFIDLESPKMKVTATVFTVPEKRPAVGWGLQVRTEKSAKRLFDSPRGLDKMTSILKSDEANRIESNRKKSKLNTAAPTVKTNTFSATDYGSYYSCHGEADAAGPFDFYLVNTNTWVYTYIGTSSGTDNYIDFNVNEPSTYAQYRVWFDGYNEQGFTGYQPMGVPYSGISVSSGTLTFTSASDVVAIHTRLAAAYNDHADAFFSANASLTDDQLDALITSTGFDENLPLRDFEGYFGISSYRASVEAGEQAYMNGTLSYDPDTAAITVDDILRTLLDTSGEMIVGEGTVSAYQVSPLKYEGYCYSYYREHDTDAYASGKEVKIAGEFRGAMLWLGRHVAAKTKSRKAKSGGGWKKWPAVMDAHLSGTLRSDQCGDPFLHATPNKSQDRKRVFLNSQLELTFNTAYAFSGQLTSTHYIAGNNYSLSLD